MEDTELVIVGAGQAGLAATYVARTFGYEPVLLEAGERPGGSWPTYYDSLRLFSTARYSSLPGLSLPGAPDRYPTRDEVVAYLARYAEWLSPDLRLRQRACRVEREPDGRLTVATDAGPVVRARRLIVATGGLGAPFRPALTGLDTFSGTLLHASEYRSPAAFAGRRVIVVGRGNSAVQIGAELAEHARVSLAARGRLHWMPQRVLGRDGLWFLSVTGIDSAPIGRWLRHRTMPVLDDGRYRRAVAEGRPDRRPMFRSVDGDRVVWADGERERVDAIILATGYRADVAFLGATGALDPSGEPLHRHGVSTTVPGLAYVGLDFQRTFASATIRGVARDAAYVLRRLAPRTPGRTAGSNPVEVS